MSDSLPSSWTVVHQAPLSMELYRQEYESGLPFPTPRDLHNSGIKPGSLALQADFFFFFLPSEQLWTLVNNTSITGWGAGFRGIMTDRNKKCV